MRTSHRSLLGVAAAVVLLSGCANMSDTQRRTATGAGVGAVAGAVVGAATGGSVGTGAVIGAGSVVINDIPAGVVAAGNPCRIIRYIKPGS